MIARISCYRRELKGLRTLVRLLHLWPRCSNGLTTDSFKAKVLQFRPLFKLQAAVAHPCPLHYFTLPLLIFLCHLQPQLRIYARRPLFPQTHPTDSFNIQQTRTALRRQKFIQLIDRRIVIAAVLPGSHFKYIVDRAEIRLLEHLGKKVIREESRCDRVLLKLSHTVELLAILP